MFRKGWREEKFYCYTDNVKWKTKNQMQSYIFWWSQFCKILCPAKYLKVKKCTIMVTLIVSVQWNNRLLLFYYVHFSVVQTLLKETCIVFFYYYYYMLWSEEEKHSCQKCVSGKKPFKLQPNAGGGRGQHGNWPADRLAGTRRQVHGWKSSRAEA